MEYTKEDIKVLPKPKNWEELIEAIRLRPEMYLYRKSPLCFAAYVSGVQYAESIFSSEIEGFSWGEFEEWVAQKYNPRALTFNSFTLVLHFEPEEEKAFNLWYQWFDEFKQENL